METTDASVSGIIAAFRASLDEFRSYRERKRKSKKAAKNKALAAKKEKEDGDELKLSQSLRQGAVDVQREYERHFRVYGDQYALGDSTAHSSLGRTLRRLNTCLHNIIASLLSCGQRDVRIDYKHLTSVSDISRHEALEALSLLSYRMSLSALSLHQSKKDNRQRQAQDAKAKAPRKPLAARSESNLSNMSKKTSSMRPEIRKVRLKSESTPKLALVRPKPKRSSSSSSSSCSNSPRSTVTPLPSPPPAYYALPTAPPSPMRQPLHLPPPANNIKRRQDKLTPSVYTFASASTRLGEIPENRWATPWDHEAMARLNHGHAGKPWPPLVVEAGEKQPKRGFWGMFRKSGAGKALEVGA